MQKDRIETAGAGGAHPAATGVLVATTLGVACWCLARVASAGWPRDSSAGLASVDEVLVSALAWVGALLTAWLALTSLVAVVASAPGAVGAVFERLARLLTPQLLRRALSLSLGASMGTVALPAPVAAATSPADAGGGQHGLPAPTPGYSVSTRAVDGPQGGDGGSAPAAPAPGWLPDRPPPAVNPHHARLLAPPLRPTVATSDRLTVRRGDTLWSIAAAHLGPGASDAEVAAEWPRWYEANRPVIGDDPDDIVPGQRLQAPLPEAFR